MIDRVAGKVAAAPHSGIRPAVSESNIRSFGATMSRIGPGDGPRIPGQLVIASAISPMAVAADSDPDQYTTLTRPT
jgi:hypothetical protein